MLAVWILGTGHRKKTVLFFHPYYETAIMLASFVAAAFIVARAVELDTLVWSFGKHWEHNRSGASNVIVQSELSIINKKHKTMEQPREESKIAFEVIPLLKSRREDDCLLCLASHHSQTLAFDALVVPL